MNTQDTLVAQQGAELCEPVTLPGEQWRQFIKEYQLLLDTAIWYSVLDEGSEQARHTLRSIKQGQTR